ncbi:CoA ester lyase [Pseudomonadota bacterium]|nr:CoA ester lyase [Pseudomonadota bacterium]
MPGTKTDLYEKAVKTGANIICLELEDGIAPQDKALARDAVVKFLESNRNAKSEPEQVIRVNPINTAEGMKDLLALLKCKNPPSSIMFPKINNPEEVALADHLFEDFEVPTRIQIIIETNHGLEAAFEIAQRSNRTDALFFGGVDMAAELRCSLDWDALSYGRSRVVHAAATAELDVLDVPFLDLSDLKGLKHEALKAKALGFTGKGAIHPSQIAIINQVFMPSKEELDYAQKIINEFEKASTGLIVIDGKLIEKPVLRRMYRILASAGK